MPVIRKVEKVKRYESKNYQGRELLDRSSLWNVEYVWYLRKRRMGNCNVKMLHKVRGEIGTCEMEKRTYPR